MWLWKKDDVKKVQVNNYIRISVWQPIGNKEFIWKNTYIFVWPLFVQNFFIELYYCYCVLFSFFVIIT